MTMEIRTRRLLLRPPRKADAEGLAALAGNLKVARMTARIPHPYSVEDARRWIAETRSVHERGNGRRFAILVDEALAGAIGIEGSGDGRYELGYWIGEPWWGAGIATEAATAIIRFARDSLGANTLEAGCLYGNPASARVLAKCGFVRTGEVMQWCESRGQAIKCHRLTLELDEAARP
jgi:RimJ/RimL family protein N-acetyltransferase